MSRGHMQTLLLDLENKILKDKLILKLKDTVNVNFVLSGTFCNVDVAFYTCR